MAKLLFITFLILLHTCVIGSLILLDRRRKLTPARFSWIFTTYLSLPMAYAILYAVISMRLIQWQALFFAAAILAVHILIAYLFSSWIGRLLVPGLNRMIGANGLRSRGK